MPLQQAPSDIINHTAEDIGADQVVHLMLTLQIPRKHGLMPRADQVGGT